MDLARVGAAHVTGGELGAQRDTSRARVYRRRQGGDGLGERRVRAAVYPSADLRVARSGHHRPRMLSREFDDADAQGAVERPLAVAQGVEDDVAIRLLRGHGVCSRRRALRPDRYCVGMGPAR